MVLHYVILVIACIHGSCSTLPNINYIFVAFKNLITYLGVLALYPIVPCRGLLFPGSGAYAPGLLIKYPAYPAALPEVAVLSVQAHPLKHEGSPCSSKTLTSTQNKIFHSSHKRFDLAVDNFSFFSNVLVSEASIRLLLSYVAREFHSQPFVGERQQPTRRSVHRTS